MKKCTKCGAVIADEARFCVHCGATQGAAQLPTAKAAAPAVSVAKADTPPARAREKACTCCATKLAQDVIFCPQCGTKLYVRPAPFIRKGELLMRFEPCELVKMGLLKTKGSLHIYDDKLLFQAGSNAHQYPLSDIAQAAAASVLGRPLSLKVTTKAGKSFVYAIEAEHADFLPYIIELLLDYRYMAS
nr:zinc-ribbon domain-containing protein [Maliibacterium massiliense]